MTQMKVVNQSDSDENAQKPLAETVVSQKQREVTFAEDCVESIAEGSGHGAVVLMTGATGGIGQHLKSHLLSTGVASQVIPISRQSQSGCPIKPCDLVKSVPDLKDVTQGAQGDDAPKIKVDWIIHLATSYQEEDDLKMLEHLLECAKEGDIGNFMYISSWVVHFPSAIMSAEYIKMKRACEDRLIHGEVPACIKSLSIVRPSVVTGPGLSWSQVLTKLSWFAPLLPSAISRSFVTVDKLNETIVDELKNVEDQIDVPESRQTRVVTSLGRRSLLKEKASEHAISGWLAICWKLAQALVWPVIIVLFVWSERLTGLSRESLVWLFAGIYLLKFLSNKPLAWLLSKVSDYLGGFVVTHFEPNNEHDLLALIDHRNENVHIRGYNNAHLYFHLPNSPRHTTVSLRHYNRVLAIDTDRMVMRVQAGAHFGQLLPLLEEQGLWMDNYPNYHFISVGSCIMTAIHGSSLSYPFIADLMTWIRYYDRDSGEIIELKREQPQFASVIFNTERLGRIVILEAEMRICKREYYRLTTKTKPVEELDFEDIQSFIDQAHHYEIRINRPKSKEAFLQSYEQVAENGEGILAIKADKIGKRWNFLQKNFFHSWWTSQVAKGTINYEWFFEPQDFARFWREISGDRTKFKMYKLLVRYNRKREDIDTPYHGTISIDVTIQNASGMIEISKDLFRKYRPLEHHGKYSIEKHHLS